MKKLLVALIASAFATVAFAQDKTKDEKKKAEATTAPAAAPAKKDAAPAATKDAAPAAKKDAAPAKKDAAPAAKKDDKMASGDKPKDDTKKDVKKP